MKQSVLCVLFTVCITSTALSEPSILVYHEYGDGWGGAVIQAVEELWPDCTPEAFVGAAGQPGFNQALRSGEWDIIILECWQDGTDGLDWTEVQQRYLQDRSEVFVYNWHFWGSSGKQFQLYQAMGVLDVAPSSYSTQTQLWDPDHPIALGVTDWDLYGIFPGGGGSVIRRIELCYDEGITHGICGWAEEWGGGILIAEDGESVVSGFCPAYAYEGVAIWKNILEFLYSGSSMQSSTWGGIKSVLSD